MRTEDGLDPEDWDLWHALLAVRASVERALEQRLQRDADISVSDFDVLRGLVASADGRLRAGALAETLGWEKSRISHQVRRMAERGLLQRVGCPTDGRGTWVELAEPGERAYRASACGYAEVLQGAFFARMDPAHRSALEGLTGRVLEPAAR